MSNISTGKQGENIAKEFLIKNGYKIVETNKRFSRFCEIDIVALDNNTLVFIEVKTRTTDFCGHPLEAITKSKFKHIHQGALIYIQENPQFKKFRIDAISVILKPKIKIEHLKNISL